ncbi:MAG: extracellular solute-binding protein [Lachnospiraceae bacterium]
MVKRFLEKFYLAIIFFLLYAPIVTLMILSFNASKSRAKWGGFTLKWYLSMFQDETILNALYMTLLLAILSALIATLIGTAAAIGLTAMRKRPRNLILAGTNIPMMNADIVTGISLMLLFLRFSEIIPVFELGFATILIAHITFNIPYVILSVMPKLKQTNKSNYEAAIDLGATPFYAFRKVVLPDILPGIISGFLLAFTMSLDDFVITHFTKGAGINTLSTKIYSEVRKGIKPEMYALSTLLFLTVLLLLLFINKRPATEKKVTHTSSKGVTYFKRGLGCFAVIALIIVAYLGYPDSTPASNQIVVYNWGEYLDPDVLTLFTKETGIEVIYEEYETNEIMYPKVKTGAVKYDVICPSDYMIQRMIQEDMLEKLDYDKLPNSKYIGESYFESSKGFDTNNEYSVPYCWGTVGILYNTKMVTEPVTSWDILWNPKYKGQILMQDSVRDAFAVAQKKLGYSLNTTDVNECEKAKQLLIDQKPLVQAYVIDQVRDKMIGNEAALGVIYSGEAIYVQQENPNIEYVVPDEGSNIWIDSWVIPKNASNPDGAHAFINFLCRPDIALKNFEYITYSTPNEGAKALMPEEMQNNTIAFPDEEIISRCETFSFLGDEADAYYNNLWKEVKSQ